MNSFRNEQDSHSGAAVCGKSHVDAMPPLFVAMNPSATEVDLR